MKDINDINFLDDRSEKGGVKSAPIVYSLLCVTILLFILNFFWGLSKDVKELESEYNDIANATIEVENEIARYQGVVQEATETPEGTEEGESVLQQDTYQQAFDNLVTYMENDYSPLDENVVNAIQDACVDGAFYSKYEVSDTYFQIKGYAQGSNQVANVVYNLRKTGIFDDIRINYITLVAEMDNTKSLNYDLYEFEITGIVLGGENNE